MSINVIVASLISLVGFFVIWGNLKSIVRIRKKETRTRDYTIPYHAFQALGIVPMLMVIGLTFNHLPKDGLTTTIILLLLMTSVLCDILASKYKEPE